MMPGTCNKLLAGVLVAGLVDGGCATLISPTMPVQAPRSAVVMDPVETADCLRPSAGRDGVGYAPLEAPAEDPALLGELADIPPAVQRTARAAGLESVLVGLLRAEARSPGERSITLVAMRLQVVARISSLEIELASLLFEADCTGDQMEAALLELDRRAGKRELALTIASIAVGALIGVGAGVWDLSGTESKGPAALGITAGAGTAVLGIAALTPKRGRVVFRHDRNLFLPLVSGEDPERLYPPFVFRLLNSPRTPGEPTPRDQLLRVWQRIIDEAIPAEDRAIAQTVLYGKGGVYDGDLLDVRERMYDALESQLNAFDQDLELLYRFLSRFLDDSG